jgi:hypothetical protein
VSLQISRRTEFSLTLNILEFGRDGNYCKFMWFVVVINIRVNKRSDKSNFLNNDLNTKL